MKIYTHQSGAVLFVGLMMLLVMSLIAITGMQGATLEERMAGNARDSMVALQSAEAALQAAEEFLDPATGPVVLSLSAFDANGSDGLYDNSDDQLWKTIDWDSTDSAGHMAFNPNNVTTEPRYVIQHISQTQVVPNLIVENYGQGEVGKTVELFRVTARGTCGRDNKEVILQSIYGAER